MPQYTLFAPAERDSIEDIELSSQSVAGSGLINHITHIIPNIVLILNSKRQLVYGNKRLLELMHTDSFAPLLGKRPGELLNCIHSTESVGGCGTTEFCRQCGAVKAILKSQQEKILTCEECQISAAGDQSYEFKVWASPWNQDGQEFTVFSLQDVSNEKRRDVLEQTFFHDIGNLLQVMMSYTDFLAEQTEESDPEIISTLVKTSRELNDEIQSHQKLLAAEKGTLNLLITKIQTHVLLTELMFFFQNSRLGEHHPILLPEPLLQQTFFSDRSLLQRVLINMVKNAIEASPRGSIITLECSNVGNSLIFAVSNPGFMSREYQLQVFKRSFSTKGKGRGIGTFSMKLFGEKYLKGKVWFKTDTVSGTTFYLELPLAHPDQQAWC